MSMDVSFALKYRQKQLAKPSIGSRHGCGAACSASPNMRKHAMPAQLRRRSCGPGDINPSPHRAPASFLARPINVGSSDVNPSP